MSFIVDTRAEEPTKIPSDRQEESVNKLQTIMEVDKLSSIPEGTVLNTVSHEGSHPSESSNCEQTDSSLVMSNELITEVHDHENDQTQMQGRIKWFFIFSFRHHIKMVTVILIGTKLFNYGPA